MDRPPILIPIETKVREYHGKLLFAAYAARAGYRVVLGDQLELVDMLSRFPPAFYVDKSVTVSKEDWFARLEQIGNVPISWDEEGLVVRSYDVYRNARLHPPSVDRLKAFWTWGPRHRDAVIASFPARADVVHATGHPRFDLLRPEWRDFFRPGADRIRERFGSRILLVNTNHAFANHYRGLEGIRKLLNKYPLGSQSDFQRGWFAFQQKNLELYKQIIPRLSEAFRDHTVIVRPSPSENHAMWRDFVQLLPNVHMTAEGNVDEWISAAEAVLHFNCTTGVEAYLLDKPSIAIRAEDNDVYEAELPKALSWHARSVDDVLDVLRTTNIPSLRDDSERACVAAEFISGLEGRTASERSLEVLPGTERPASERRATIALRLRLSDLVAGARSRLAMRRDDGYERQKFGGVSPVEVSRDLQRMCDLDPSFEGLHVSRTGPSVYTIVKDGDTP